MARGKQLQFIVGVIFFLSVVGCGGGGSHPNPSETVTVSGNITLDGKPLTNAVVMFLPVDGGSNAESYMADADRKGHYEFQLVLPMEYKVHVDRMVNGGSDPALGQYQGETTTLRAIVTKEANTFDFDLE